MHFAQAPEALLGRNDSKNPATTCKGITTSGRPCRRALAGSKPGSPSAKLGDAGIQSHELYCWQHKEQAGEPIQEQKSAVPRPRKGPTAGLAPLQERSSIETLVQRLGIDSTTQDAAAAYRSNGKQHGRSSEKPMRAGRDRLDEKTQVSAQFDGAGQDLRRRPKPPPKKKIGFWESLCCMAGGDDDYIEVVRHRKRVDPNTHVPNPTSTVYTDRPRPDQHRRHAQANLPLRPAPAQEPSRHSQSAPPPPSRGGPTGHLLDLIPPHTSPQTTSALLAELLKPISPHDEDGYIYIFWLTPQTKPAPDDGLTRSLLAAPAQHGRRLSDVMTEYSFDGTEPATRGRDVVMLKIGRANNVTRRMQEWQRQCGYALNLVRWYPYLPSAASNPSTPQTSPHRPSSRRDDSGVRKVPFVKRVERLIHLELAEKQVKRQCAACGREHREWFEIPASQAGVKSVDECIRRWTEWAEKRASENMIL